MDQAIDLLVAGDMEAFVHAVILLADAGDLYAASHYGTWLRYGLYVPADAKLAAQYLEPARGISEVNLVLADMYATGDGVDKDPAEARLLLEAMPTNAMAQYKLATLYDHGFGGPLDDALAVETYLAAAGLGSADAMYTLGRRYLMGEGVAQSAADAYFWLSVGLKLGGGPDTQTFDDQLAFNIQQAVDLGLTSEELDELDAAVETWQPGQASPVNDAPILDVENSTVVGVVDRVSTGTLHGGTDADGDRLSFELVPGSMQNGDVTIDAVTGAWSFTPPPDYSGTAEFRYRLSDGTISSNEVTINLVFERAVIASDDVVSLNEAATLVVNAADGLLSNDTTLEPDRVLTITAINGEASSVGHPIDGPYGAVTISADGSYTFTASPETAFLVEGQDVSQVVSYTITDQDGVSASATLIVTINGVEGGLIVGAGFVFGTDYADHLVGGSGRDVLLGLDGNDVIAGGSGTANEVHGGRGDDRFIVEANDTVVELADEGIDTVEARTNSHTLRANIENLFFGGTGNFTGKGNGLDNLIVGGAGDDVLSGGGGNDQLQGGSGYDVADYSAASAGVTARLDWGMATADGDGGVDSYSSIEEIRGSAFNDLIYGNGAGNILRGGGGRDIILGLDGDDVLYGGTGTANELYGGTGDDYYVLEAEGDTVVENAGEGRDSVEARTNSHTLRANIENLFFGGTGNFTGKGNGLDNLIVGGAGDDVLSGGGGNDQLQGGSGYDVADYSAASAGVTARLDWGMATADGDGGVDSYSSIEEIRGSAFNDLIYGNGAGNILRGGGGRDIILGLDGDDVLYGGTGTANELYGGTGDDYYVLEAEGDTVVENAGEGRDSVEARTNSHTLRANIENLFFGGTGNFTGKGNGLDNLIVGGAGDDVLSGGGGNDRLQGGLGQDTVLLRGVQADYTIVAEGNGWRITDTTAGRDGSILTTSIETIAFGDGTTRQLQPSVVLSAGPLILPALAEDKPGDLKTFGDEPLVLTDIQADDFLDLNGVTHANEPQIWPGTYDDIATHALGGIDGKGIDFSGSSSGGGHAFGLRAMDPDIDHTLDDCHARLDFVCGIIQTSDLWG